MLYLGLKMELPSPTAKKNIEYGSEESVDDGAENSHDQTSHLDPFINSVFGPWYYPKCNGNAIRFLHHDRKDR